MNVKFLLIVSAVANVALAVAIFEKRASQVTPSGPVVQTKSTEQILPETNGVAPLENVNPEAPEVFKWSRLAAADLKVYRDNLRAVHCPEWTVRDIIISEIDALFADKRREIGNEIQRQFWEAAARKLLKPEEDPLSKQMEALTTDRDKMVQDVLGEELSLVDPATRHARLVQRFAWLPEAKRDQMVQLEEDFRKANTSQPGDPSDEALVAKSRKSLETAQKALLTPDEYTEFRLRTTAAGRWTSQLQGFEPTEDEWRAVAKMQLDIQDARQGADANLNTTPEERIALRKQMESTLNESIEGVLGADRFAQYQLAKDHNYQQTRVITERYNLPDSVAQQAFDVQKTAMQSAEQVANDASLSQDARDAAVTAIQQESEKTLGNVLGQKVFGTYQKYNGMWLTNLNQPARVMWGNGD